MGVNTLPSYGVHAKATTADAAAAYLASENTAGDVRVALRAGAAAAAIDMITDSDLAFVVNGATKALFTKAGGFELTDGVVFSSGGTKLGAYVEGTFTPTLVSSGGGTPTYGNQTGRYTRIGNLVFCRGRLVISSKAGLSAGNLRMGGLPITIANQSNARLILGSVTYSNTSGGLSAGETIRGFGQQNDTYIHLLEQAENSNANFTVTNLVDSFDLQFNFFYEAA